MEIYKLQQLWVLGVCVIAGILCGIVYDSFRAYRRCFPQRDVYVALCDVIFWLVSAVIVYLAVYLSNNAELRWHELIGLGIGFVLYILYISPGCIRVLCFVIRAMHRIWKYVSKILCIPRRFLHILILPLRKASTVAKARILYSSRTLTSNITDASIKKIRCICVKKCKKPDKTD